MKKSIIVTILYLIIFLIIYILQANFFTWFTIAKVQPNLFVLLALFIGLFTGRYIGTSTGVIMGLLLDLFIGRKIGISAIMLALVGFLGGYFDKNFSKESKITMIFMVIAATLIFEVGQYVLNILILSINIEILGFIKVLSIEIIYNVILTIIIYPLTQKIGFKIENKFKGSKLLTRYF